MTFFFYSDIEGLKSKRGFELTLEGQSCPLKQHGKDALNRGENARKGREERLGMLYPRNIRNVTGV